MLRLPARGPLLAFRAVAGSALLALFLATGVPVAAASARAPMAETTQADEPEPQRGGPTVSSTASVASAEHTASLPDLSAHLVDPVRPAPPAGHDRERREVVPGASTPVTGATERAPPGH